MPRKARPARRADVCPAWSRAALVGLHSPSISPAAKPRWPVIGPTGAAILPFPSRLRRAGAPTAKPRRLSPFGSISPARNRAAGRFPRRGQRARCPIFALLKCGPAFSRGVCRGTFLCSTAGPALAPRRLSPFGSISLRETALAGRCPRRGQRARYPIFALLKCGPAFSRGVCRGTFPCSPAGPALAPRRSAPFHPKTIVRFRMSVSPEFSVFFICPPPFFCIGSGAHRYKNPRRGYPAADLTPFQFPDSIFPSPTPEAVRPPPRRHIFWGFCIAINNFFFPSLIGVVIQLLLRTLPRMPKKESAPAFLFCFAPKGSFLPVLHSLFSLPLSFQMSQG